MDNSESIKSINNINTLNANGKLREIQELNELIIDDNFYYKYNRLITGIVSRILDFNLKQDTEDCVSEIYAALISRTGEYNPERGTIEAFISIISRSVTLNFRKKLCKNQREVVIQSNESDGDNVIETDFPDKSDDYDIFINFETIKEVLKFLSKDEKTLFTLKYVYYYKASEIAKYYGISIASAEKRSTRLRKKLQKLLKSNGLSY